MQEVVGGVAVWTVGGEGKGAVEGKGKAEGQKGSSSMDHAEGEDAFEALEREMEQDAWRAEMIDNDGMEGGMEMGLIDEELAQFTGLHGGAEVVLEEEEEGVRDWQGWWGMDEGWAGAGGIEGLSTKELERIAERGHTRYGGGGPKRYAWDEEFWEKQEMDVAAYEAELGKVDQGSGRQRGEEGPQELDSRTLWQKFKDQAQHEARMRYGKWGNKYKMTEEGRRNGKRREGGGAVVGKEHPGPSPIASPRGQR